MAKQVTPKRTKLGKLKRGAVLCPVGSKAVPCSKGTYTGIQEGGPVSPDHSDDSHLIGRRVTTQQGGLSSRSDWVAFQSGGLSPRELLRAARD